MPDIYGNYQAAVSPAWTVATDVIVTGSVGRGHGAPDANTPTWLQYYIDEDACEVYANCDGTTSGWFLVTASISGVTGVYTYEGDPNGNVTATGPAVCIGKNTTAGAVWVKDTPGASNNEWYEIIASPNG